MIAPGLGSVRSHVYRAPPLILVRPNSVAIFFSPGAFFKTLTGVLSSSGDVVRKMNLALAGSVSSIGTLTTQSSIPVASTLDTVGGLLGTLLELKLLTGTLTTAGSLAMRANQVIAGTVVAAGALFAQLRQTLSGTVSSSGILANLQGQVVQGVLTMSGAVTVAVRMPLDAILSFVGAIAARQHKLLTGILSFIGTLTGLSGTLIITPNAPKNRYRPRWLVNLTVGASTKRYSSEDLDDVP